MKSAATKVNPLDSARQQAQRIANATRQATDLYNDDNIARMTLAGWPMRGQYVGTFRPEGAQQ